MGLRGVGRLFGTVLAALAVARPALPASDLEPALCSRLERIESAFRAGDADALAPSLSSVVRVRVDLKDLPDGPTSYGTGQLQVILMQLFRKQRTREFSFRKLDGKQDLVVSTPETAFARARWVRRNGSLDTTETLNFTLRQEGGDWRIYEILSSR
jgi:hypothetical protein